MSSLQRGGVGELDGKAEKHLFTSPLCKEKIKKVNGEEAVEEGCISGQQTRPASPIWASKNQCQRKQRVNTPSPLNTRTKE